ncbi:MAG TPA: hypothetical protein VIF10_06895 [Methylobacter sp.]|jgi:hypothetical protein
MPKRDLIRKELLTLYDSGLQLLNDFQKKEDKQFHYDYQSWYTKALKAVASLAPDRHAEFRSYYEIDPKRKTFGYGTYVIQDYLKGVRPLGVHYNNFVPREQVGKCFYNQITIFHSINDRVDSVIGNIEGELYAELQDSEIVIARQLAKVSPRAAGALIGVVIEGHLQKAASNHGVKVVKKSPTIADLNDPLKSANVIDTPAWRKISYLGDLRNLCSHKKDVEPTKEQVEELIQGAEWLTKNVF